MSSKTKIVVLRMKELIYTAIFVGLGILLIILLVYMFSSKGGKQKDSAAPTSYIPGVYSASLVLNGQNIDVSVTVDSDRINSINFVQLDEAVTTMYPLMEPALNELTEQIIDSQSTANIQLDEGMKYTQSALVSTIEEALKKAAP
jgi:uncharacterized protein with FMN-binding domain